MFYLVKTPLFSYLINYLNDDSLFRESKIISINRHAVKDIKKYKKTGFKTKFIEELAKREFNLKSCIIKGSFKKFYPLHVQIELTDNCNLCCDYCYRDSKYKNPKAKYIDYKELKKFLLKYKEKNLLEIGVTGGEPTLHPEFIKIMKFVLKNFELVELVTNGTNFKVILALLKDLEERDRKKFNLSISFNRWFRDFEKFEKGYHYLNETLKKITKKHPVRIILTDFLYSKEKAEKVKRILKESGVKDIDFSFVAPIGRGKNKINELENISKFKKDKSKNSFVPNPLNCGLIFKHTVINPEGNLRPCALFPQDFKIGSIKDNFVSEKYKRLGIIPSPNKKICKSCEYFDYCVGCIYKGLFNSNENCNYKKFLKKNTFLNFLPHIN